MAAVFAVFLVVGIIAFARAEGRAQRIERLRALATSAVGIGKALLAKGTEIVELAAARLAQEHRNSAGLDWVIAAARRSCADDTERSADL
jgi:hypothetical protein